MALTAPSACLTPRAEYTCATPSPHPHVARHSIRPIMPRSPTLEPCSTLPEGPVHPLTQGLFALLPLRAEPLGDRLAPHRTLARPRLPTSMRQAEHVTGGRFPLAPSLAPCACPTPTRTAARLVRGQCEVNPVAACPQVAPKLRGGGFVRDADEAIVTVPHDADVSPGVPAAPWRRPEVNDIVPGTGCQEGTCAPPVRRPCHLWSPLPLLQHARLEPRAPVADDALVPTPGLDTLHQPSVVQRLVKAPDGGIAYPVDVALFTPHRDRLQGLVRVAAWAGAVRATKPLLLVDGVEHLDRRPLDNCVFQRRRADGALAPIGFRDGDTRDRWGLIGSPLQAV
jgi:hypothetical protein